MNHSAALVGGEDEKKVKNYTHCLKKALHNTFRYGQGTRDMSGEEGLTTGILYKYLTTPFQYIYMCINIYELKHPDMSTYLHV